MQGSGLQILSDLVVILQLSLSLREGGFGLEGIEFRDLPIRTEVHKGVLRPLVHFALSPKP